MKYVDIELDLDQDLIDYLHQVAEDNAVTVDQVVSDLLWRAIFDAEKHRNGE